MYFYREDGKIKADARGNLILSKNEKLATQSSRSAGPRTLSGANYVMLRGANFRTKVRATVAALNWIWSN